MTTTTDFCFHMAHNLSVQSMGWISIFVETAFLDGIFFSDGTDKFRGVVILWHFIHPVRPIRHHKNKKK
jgi:hypothetical protein